jgi:hypothetical protein
MKRLLLSVVVGCVALHAKVDPLEGLWQAMTASGAMFKPIDFAGGSHSR